MAFEGASKVIHDQMQIFHEIAGLLGGSSSETKVMLLELMEILKGDPENGRIDDINLMQATPERVVEIINKVLTAC